MKQISVPDLELLNKLCESIKRGGGPKANKLLNDYMSYLGSKYDFNSDIQGVHPISGKIVNFHDYPLWTT